MERAIDSPRNDEPAREEDARALSLRWSARVSLTPRILFVNVFALAMLAGGFFYLDSYRSRIVDDRVRQSIREARLVAEALVSVPDDQRTDLALRLARATGARLRIYDDRDLPVIDTRTLGLRNFVLQDPDKQDGGQESARILDAIIDTVVGTPRAPLYREHRSGLNWPDVRTVRATTTGAATVWRAPDRTPVITAAAQLPHGGVVMTTNNVRDITQTVRVERFRLGIVLMIVSIVSVLLSLFLARTIVRPLRRLAYAAVRVRMGRAREVVVPRLPYRRDEIGMLARALSDMSQALRRRIDAVEAFAADVSHELKNPLASLRSAVDGLGVVKDEALQTRLLDIVRDDVMRLDRLITDVADISRLDGELSRARFEAVDLGPMIEAMFAAREQRGRNRDVRVAFARPYVDTTVVFGDPVRLARMIENLVDNAVSFSPPGGLVEVSAIGIKNIVLIAIEDEGPGIPPGKRDDIFRRFHSDRPDTETPERHSGLGLAIAKAIADGHDGTIEVRDRQDGRSGAHFLVTLPRAPET
jgi:two-component system sensor histidine kinase ChvG